MEQVEVDKRSLDVSSVEGRTPYTLTAHVRRRQGHSVGIKVCWSQPPRIEHVLENSQAEMAGIKPGDFIVFIGNTNVTTLEKARVMDLIRNGPDDFLMELFRPGVHSRGNTLLNIPVDHVRTDSASQPSHNEAQECANEENTQTDFATSLDSDSGSEASAAISTYKLTENPSGKVREATRERLQSSAIDLHAKSTNEVVLHMTSGDESEVGALENCLETDKSPEICEGSLEKPFNKFEENKHFQTVPAIKVHGDDENAENKYGNSESRSGELRESSIETRLGKQYVVGVAKVLIKRVMSNAIRIIEELGTCNSAARNEQVCVNTTTAQKPKMNTGPTSTKLIAARENIDAADNMYNFDNRQALTYEVSSFGPKTSKTASISSNFRIGPYNEAMSHLDIGTEICDSDFCPADSDSGRVAMTTGTCLTSSSSNNCVSRADHSSKLIRKCSAPIVRITAMKRYGLSCNLSETMESGSCLDTATMTLYGRRVTEMLRIFENSTRDSGEAVDIYRGRNECTINDAGTNVELLQNTRQCQMAGDHTTQEARLYNASILSMPDRCESGFQKKEMSVSYLKNKSPHHDDCSDSVVNQAINTITESFQSIVEEDFDDVEENWRRTMTPCEQDEGTNSRGMPTRAEWNHMTVTTPEKHSASTGDCDGERPKAMMMNTDPHQASFLTEQTIEEKHDKKYNDTAILQNEKYISEAQMAEEITRSMEQEQFIISMTDEIISVEDQRNSGIPFTGGMIGCTQPPCGAFVLDNNSPPASSVDDCVIKVCVYYKIGNHGNYRMQNIRFMHTT